MNQPTPNPFPGIFMLAGALVASAGAWWVYRPAGVVAFGLTLLMLGFSGRTGFGGGE
jgi:hypothetical protein